MSQNDFNPQEDTEKDGNIEGATDVTNTDATTSNATLTPQEQFKQKMAMFQKSREQQSEALNAVPDKILMEVENEKENIAGQINDLKENSNYAAKKANPQNEKVMEVMQRAQQNKDRSSASSDVKTAPPTNTAASSLTGEGAKEDNSASPPPPPPVDAEVEVKIASNELKASVLVIPPNHGGKDITDDMIKAALNEKGVVYGILTDEIKKITSLLIYDKWIEVAAGTPPTNGANGVVTIHVNTAGVSNGPRENEDGTVDYKELGIVKNVIAGDLLATATMPTEGEPGTTVLNETIVQRPGVPAKMPGGAGTTLSEDGLTLSAAIDGNIEYKGNTFNISPIFEIKGNVDTSTGNINFVGSVRVTGDVQAGFSIVSGGDIKVNGMVEGAVLEAAGNISVETGISGMGIGKIIAMGEVKAKFIESCEVETGGNLYAEAIINAEVKCDGDLIMSKGKGAIMGGNILVAKNLSAITIGSISNIATNVTIGYTATLTAKIKATRKSLDSVTSDIMKLDQAIVFLTDLYNKNTITPQRYELLKQSIYSRNAKAEERDLLSVELMAMEEEFNAPTTSILRCNGVIHQGVKINISNCTYRVTSELNKCMLYLNEGEIIVGQG